MRICNGALEFCRIGLQSDILTLVRYGKEQDKKADIQKKRALSTRSYKVHGNGFLSRFLRFIG